MKKLLFLLVCSLLLLFVGAAPATANKHHMQPLISKAVLAIGPNDDHWSGSITGGVRGTMQMTGLDYTYPVEMVFTESFGITTCRGDIEGYVIGVFPGPAFSSCGWVTSATGHWSKMLGWTMYQSGEVTESGETYVARSHVVFMPPFRVE